MRMHFQRETNIQGQPIEYAITVVDKDKINSRREGQQQNVSVWLYMYIFQ